MSDSETSKSDLAVLTQNYPTRLRQANENDRITFRSGKSWATAMDEVDANGSMSVYFRTVTEDNIERITHEGDIVEVVTHPEEHHKKARQLREHLPEDDSYLDDNDLPTTLYLVTEITAIGEPFSQVTLKKRDDTRIDTDYQRGYAIVKNRKRAFNQGWTSAINDLGNSEELLEPQESSSQDPTWGDLGYRLGGMFGETDDDLREEMYNWCNKTRTESIE